jgi:hypothetical protein
MYAQRTINCSYPAFINPSFEGITGFKILPSNWHQCLGTCDTYPTSFGDFSTGASHGNNYIGCLADVGNNYLESFGQKLKSPLSMLTPYRFTIDLAASTFQNDWFPGGFLEIYGGNDSCDQTELLWTSPAIYNTTSWKTYTVSFTPQANYSFIRFIPHARNDLSSFYLYVDNIQQDSACIEETDKCGEVFVPTAFSPNENGTNEKQCVMGGVFHVFFISDI